MRTVVSSLLLLAAIPAAACINESYTFEEEYQLNTGQSPVAFLRERMRAQPSSELAAPARGGEERTESKNEFAAAEYDAVRDIYTGNYSTAVEKLQALEAVHPGNYSTAANLGTAYELAGDNHNALHWISEGIKRNEESHYGTEWLHKKILETKIAMESDPEYLKANGILPFPESARLQPHDYVLEYDGSLYGLYSLAKALQYQLEERMLFVKPTDPVVADLLYSFATLEANSHMLGPALELLGLAREYGYSDLAGLDEKRARYQALYFVEKTKSWTKIIGYIAAVCVSPALLYFAARFVVRHLERILNTAE